MAKNEAPAAEVHAPEAPAAVSLDALADAVARALRSHFDGLHRHLEQVERMAAEALSRVPGVPRGAKVVDREELIAAVRRDLLAELTGTPVAKELEAEAPRRVMRGAKDPGAVVDSPRQILRGAKELGK